MTKFFKALIVLIGIGAIVFLLGEPHFEGRNVDATFFEIYFNDPFLAYAYIASISFFMILYQAFRLLGYVERKRLFSADSVKALRTIRYGAMAMIGFIVIGTLWLLQTESDDRPPVLAMCLVTTLVSIGIAFMAARCEKKVRKEIV